MATTKNFLPEQYRKNNKLGINHNYLNQQFSDHEIIWSKMREVIKRGDFTLGSEVDLLEEEHAHISGTKHAIGVGSGTDAIFLSLKAFYPLLFIQRPLKKFTSVAYYENNVRSPIKIYLIIALDEHLVIAWIVFHQ